MKLVTCIFLFALKYESRDEGELIHKEIYYPTNMKKAPTQQIMGFIMF